jgi:hypothetical protein
VTGSSSFTRVEKNAAERTGFPADAGAHSGFFDEYGMAKKARKPPVLFEPP